MVTDAAGRVIRGFAPALALAFAASCGGSISSDPPPGPSASAPAPAPTGADGRAEVAREVDELLALSAQPWTYEEWPGREAFACDPLHADPFAKTSDIWCRRCRRKERGAWTLVYFYSDPARGECTLQRMDARWSEGCPAWLNAALETRFGLGAPPAGRAWIPPTPRTVRVLPTETIATFDDSPHFGFSRFRDPWRSLAESHDEALTFLGPDSTPAREDSRAEAFRACRDAGIAICDDVDLSDAAQVKRALSIALDRIDSTPPAAERWPALAFWIDSLLVTGNQPLMAGPDAAGTRARLERRGVSYYNDHFAGWQPQRTFLDRIARTRWDSPWGRRAFALRMAADWGWCNDPWSFQDKIRHGERFLLERPDTEITADVLLDLALAYETIWSLSKADPDDDYVEPELYAKDAPRSRRKALEYYGRWREVAGPDAPLPWPGFEHTLFLLERDLDTGQRAHYCIND